MSEISWVYVAAFAASGMAMALLSCLVGMRPKVENPAWWALYAVWITVVLRAGIPSVFWTLWVSSVLAGLLHGVTSALLLDRYIASNPWHADRMEGPRGKLGAMFVGIGAVVGTAFGLLVAGIGWGIERWLT
ncbi:MAG: hypothetical protein PVJ51_01645 [Acidobacteriota bacterium]|jgi:hypothetical protein